MKIAILRLVVLLFAAIAAGSAAAQTRPNIVVVMTDDQTVRDLAFMPRTLNLLAEKGVTFTNSFVDHPLCCPSRATFLTGQSAHNHKIIWNVIIENGDWLYGYDKFEQLGEDETLPVWLQRAGFTTFYFGKYMNGYGNDRAGAVARQHVPPGWNSWNGKVDRSAYNFYDYWVNENGAMVRYGCDAADYEADVAKQKALSFIQAQQGASQPFFMWIAPLAPHGGKVGGCNRVKTLGSIPADRHMGLFADDLLDMPPSFNEAIVADKPTWIQDMAPMDTVDIRQAGKRQNNRREALLAVDEMVREIYLELYAIGQLDNTCLIFTSDNGYMIGDHRVREGKMLPYEQSIRVPLIISCPGMPQGVVRSQMVTNTDLVATIVELADATPGRTLDGKSLLPLIADPATPWREVMLFHGGIPGQMLYEEYVDAVNQPLVHYQAVRSRSSKYIEYDDGQREFFYLPADPDEMINYADNPTAYPGMKARLKNALDALRDCAGASCWMNELPPP